MNSSSVIKFFFLFAGMVLLQALILNRIFFLGYATPFLYIYFIIKLPVSVNRNIVLLLGFMLGLSIDIFSNTPGLNAAATTFIAFVRLPVQKLFFNKDDFGHINLSLSVLGSKFVSYSVVLVLLHHLLLLFIETFSYYNIVIVLLRALASATLTFSMVYAIEGLCSKHKKT